MLLSALSLCEKVWHLIIPLLLLKVFISILNWLGEWLNSVLCHFQQYFSHTTATAHIIHIDLSLVSPVLGYSSEVSCPRTYLNRKNSEDPVWLKTGGGPGHKSWILPPSHVGPPILNKFCSITRKPKQQLQLTIIVFLTLSCPLFVLLKREPKQQL